MRQDVAVGQLFSLPFHWSISSVGRANPAGDWRASARVAIEEEEEDGRTEEDDGQPCADGVCKNRPHTHDFRHPERSRRCCFFWFSFSQSFKLSTSIHSAEELAARPLLTPLEGSA